MKRSQQLTNGTSYLDLAFQQVNWHTALHVHVVLSVA